MTLLPDRRQVPRGQRVARVDSTKIAGWKVAGFAVIGEQLHALIRPNQKHK